MAPQPFDDRLPDREPMPRPEGWFELFCCGSMVLAIIGVAVFIALVH